MSRKRRWLVPALTAMALAGVVAGTAVATGPSEPGDAADDRAEGRDVPITDADALDRATRAALEHTGGGTVTGTEVEDEESWYEVEVTLDDGRQVDVQLDESFRVVGDEAESGEDD